MIDFTEIPDDGEQWELFARDLLTQLGYSIKSGPDRGADAGKDLLVSEELQGRLGPYTFTWLVSCKHFAASGRSVTERDELNIQERLSTFVADGFLAFYSTLASAGLNSRLQRLRDNGQIKDYRILDHRMIEDRLLRIEHSALMQRYLPNGYKHLNPIILVEDKYIPLKCHACGRDLLEDMYKERYGGVIVVLKNWENEHKPVIEEVYWCHKGKCDRALSMRKEQGKRLTAWEDLGDLITPAWFLDWVFSVMNSLRSGDEPYSDSAFESLKLCIAALSQRVLRPMSEEEKERVEELFLMGKT